ncbi:MAG: helical backbone metal receptor [Deltaproteobacteria bacterium]|jgi:iron complex transport system substrate-binding protein|nr:helical backbone metal receptor [Deltaproteobacteria bacterium]
MKNWPFILTLGILFLFTLWGHRTLSGMSSPSALPAIPRSIVSLAPSVTETLYALGLGERIVGVTQFCAYPPEVKSKPRVAGFGDINYEAVLRLRPDIVALPLDMAGNRRNLENLGLRVLSLDTRSMTGLMDAITALGKATGHEAEAASTLSVIQANLASVRARAAGRPRPTVIFSVMHAYQGLGQITEIDAIGDDGFYSEMIKAAGGRNAYQGSLSFPRLSREALAFLNPDVIIDVIPAGENQDAVRRAWQSLSSISAIKNNRLHLLTDEADTVPGPRFYQTLNKLSLAFHPEPLPQTP